MEDFFTILVLSYNRKEFLRECLNELYNTDYENYKIVIYDNASTDGSVEMLSNIRDEGVEVIFGKENVGQNAYYLMHDKCEGHVVTVDDDVLQIPKDWLSWFVKTINTVPSLGYLSADVVRDEMTNGAKPDDSNYEIKHYGDVVLQEGKWTGGWCSVVPEKIYKEIGPYVYKPELTWVPTDGFYCSRVRKQKYIVAVSNNVKVYHASGPESNAMYKELWDQKMINAAKGGYL